MSFWTRDADGLQCNQPISDSTGFNLAESTSILRDFCQNISQQNIGLRDNYSTLFKTALGDSSLNISISYIESDTCDERTITKLIIDEATCDQAFYRLLDSCQPISNDNLGFYGGSVTNDCTLFSISAEVEEIVRCGGNPSGNPADMDLEDIAKAIEEYCDHSFELSPAPGGLTSFTLTVPHGQSYNNYLSHGVAIRTRAQFSDQAQHDCLEAQAFDTRGDECRRKLKAVKDQCGGEGGGLSENAVNGCVVWTMWGENLK